MKKQITILTYLSVWWRAACWCVLVIGLTLAAGTAIAELIPITLKHDGSVSSVTFSPDGKLLATGSSDNTAKVWEMPSGNLIATMRHDGSVFSVTFSPDGKLLATGSDDNTAKVWEMPSGNLIAKLEHDGFVKSVAFSPDGKLLATASNLRKYTISEAKVWEMSTGNLIAKLRHTDYVSSVTFSPDEKLLVTGSGDNTAKVWAPNTADIPQLTQPPDGSKFVNALELK